MRTLPRSPGTRAPTNTWSSGRTGATTRPAAMTSTGNALMRTAHQHVVTSASAALPPPTRRTPPRSPATRRPASTWSSGRTGATMRPAAGTSTGSVGRRAGRGSARTFGSAARPAKQTTMNPHWRGMTHPSSTSSSGRTSATSPPRLRHLRAAPLAKGELVGWNLRVSRRAATFNEHSPALAWNPSAHEYLAVWEDHRNAATRGWDIYEQRLTG